MPLLQLYYFTLLSSIIVLIINNIIRILLTIFVAYLYKLEKVLHKHFINVRLN